MPRRPTPLPPELGLAFTTRQAREAGVSQRALARLHPVTRGVWMRRPPTCVEELALAHTLVLPDDAVFSHLTAGRLLGTWLPRRWSPREPLDVASRAPVEREGVRAHRAERQPTLLAWGLPVTTPSETWADLALMLPLDDLVVAGDWALRFRGASCTAEDLDAALDGVRRGRRRGRAALDLVRAGSASPMETRVRLLCRRAGLPEPLLNATVLDDDGEYVGAFDLVWPDERVIVEYDGAQHRTDRGQWQRDTARLRRVRELGWVVVVLTADDVLRTPVATAAMVRHALGLGR